MIELGDKASSAQLLFPIFLGAGHPDPTPSFPPLLVGLLLSGTPAASLRRSCGEGNTTRVGWVGERVHGTSV